LIVIKTGRRHGIDGHCSRPSPLLPFSLYKIDPRALVAAPLLTRTFHTLSPPPHAPSPVKPGRRAISSRPTLLIIGDQPSRLSRPPSPPAQPARGSRARGPSFPRRTKAGTTPSARARDPIHLWPTRVNSAVPSSPTSPW
jgi:hypothetical protein